MEAGKDSVPVFYVNPNMSLAQTVAKLVATKSHRYHFSGLWNLLLDLTLLLECGLWRMPRQRRASRSPQSRNPPCFFLQHLILQ